MEPWNKSYFDCRTYLLEQFETMKLNEKDLLLLLMLDLLNKESESIDIKMLAQKLKRNEKDVMEDLGRLVRECKLEVKNTGRKVCYSLRPLFEEDSISQIPQSLFDLFSDQFKRPLTATEMDRLCEWMKLYQQEFIVCALREAVVYNKMDFRYINTILVKWKSENKTLEELNGN